MGLDRASLPDSLLRRVSPVDRKAAGLPMPIGEWLKKKADKADAKREKELQNQIYNWLRLRGITAIRSRMDRATSNNVGTPDFLLAVHGRAVALEVKLPGRKPTDEQMGMLLKLAADGWEAKVVYSLDEARAIVAEVEAKA